MAKFIYKMQNILNIKHKLEAQAKSVYAEANARLREEEDKLADLKAKQQGYEDYHREILLSQINILEIKNCRKSIEGVKTLIKNQLVSVHVARKNVELARAKLNEVMMERKTYEKLREKAFEEFKLEINAQESKEIDQLISFTHGIKKQSKK